MRKCFWPELTVRRWCFCRMRSQCHRCTMVRSLSRENFFDGHVNVNIAMNVLSVPAPRIAASVCDHDELIEILLAAGADASLKDKDGLTPAETRGS